MIAVFFLFLFFILFGFIKPFTRFVWKINALIALLSHKHILFYCHVSASLYEIVAHCKVIKINVTCLCNNYIFFPSLSDLCCSLSSPFSWVKADWIDSDTDWLWSNNGKYFIIIIITCFISFVSLICRMTFVSGPQTTIANYFARMPSHILLIAHWIILFTDPRPYVNMRRKACSHAIGLE